MHRIAEQLATRRELDHAAGAHHRDAVGDIIDDREVVRDEEIGEPDLLLQVLQEIEDLRLDGDVERRDRLVADDELGLQRQSARDADALPLTAGKAVRVAVEVLSRLSPPSREGAPRRRGESRPCRCHGSRTARQEWRRPSCAG